MVTGRPVAQHPPITDQQRAALAEADLPIHWPGLAAAAVLAMLASAWWPWGFAA